MSPVIVTSDAMYNESTQCEFGTSCLPSVKGEQNTIKNARVHFESYNPILFILKFRQYIY